MPSTNTITSFYTFSPDTIIYSSQINNNFSTFRGNILPVDPNTATAINNTYNLGSSDYKWANLYCSNIIGLTAPTIQRFTSGSGTYTTPANVKYIIVEMVGGGGGGQASNSSGGSPTEGSNGGNTTFGTSLLTANGGTRGQYTGHNLGGSCTINSPAISIISVDGGNGAGGHRDVIYAMGGAGGSSFFGGAGSSGLAINGSGAKTNSGSGGGGASANGTGWASGSGGGAGGYLKALISSPAATYSYSVGGGGAGGVQTLTGGSGGSGIIIVYEFY